MQRQLLHTVYKQYKQNQTPRLHVCICIDVSTSGHHNYLNVELTGMHYLYNVTKLAYQQMTVIVRYCVRYFKNYFLMSVKLLTSHG